MPHLSPMNWLITLTLSFLMITLLSSSWWWVMTHQFKTIIKETNKFENPTWKW
uniref:ATP synthase F0 subunit 8 n=1 Tax=Paracanthobdella livanowi TaxID=2905687 RepID=A0A9E8K0Y1_9ANNE|nr:ATP synthase F0 subunit 8 [Paracanthobdella livanowi]UZT67761.1 ATP synthase F0 subunit 8 [Paracanthobdella livanowi]UZT67774.1 ATP synthase F0 subunit 8 [Paracanthobdella livanowi]